jgi:hypothetical protein
LASSGVPAPSGEPATDSTLITLKKQRGAAVVVPTLQCAVDHGLHRRPVGERRRKGASGGSKPSFQDAAERAGVDVRSGTDAGASGGSGVATGSAVPTGPSFRDAAKEVGVDVD